MKVAIELQPCLKNKSGIGIYAYEIAKIENKYNIKSTYFIWLTSPFYNIFEVEYRDVITNIVNMGHEVGLHFDETAYQIKDLEDMKHYVFKEKFIIENYFDVKIKSVSFHRPSHIVLDNDVSLGELFNSYSKKFFDEYKYISDSRGMWREGCLCKLLENTAYSKIQVLIHPIWWRKTSKNNTEKLDEFLQLKQEKLDTDLANNITIYKKKFN